MRTTLNLDEDVLRVARRVAQERGQSLGQVVSDYFRKALEPRGVPESERNGIPLLPRRPGSRPVTPDLVRELLDADE
jgi:hypothetical protein